ncbi:cytolytic toxin-alpha-like [Carassius gibelio]|uniref:cytolytic toxin-alpha-like n=1 Tax=Carassius gibelio TaxID=101364 RepID=UPI002279D8BA|nr:cytolytic toxin-alpha-like [Carassius gibelio]
MVPPLMYPKQPNFICLCAYLWLATLTVANAGISRQIMSRSKTLTPASETMEVAALGRPLSLGMLYDSRKDSFIPGLTLWDKKSLEENVATHRQVQTNLKFSSSDSLSTKSSLLDISASLKASFLAGLVEVGGSGKFLHDTKSSQQQSRVTMYYSETTRYEQLTMSQLGKITHPEVFDQQTATHVVTAVLYGAQAIMVFDRMFSEEENKQEIEGEMDAMVRSIPSFSITGDGSVNMKDHNKTMSEKITCTFYGDFSLDQDPTTYREAIKTYKNLPTLLRNNPDDVVPIKVWLYPLHLLDSKAAQIKREITTSLISDIESLMEELGEAEKKCNDLLKRTLVDTFSDIKERLHSFQESFNFYKTKLLSKIGRVLPDIRGGDMEEKHLEDILEAHRSSPFRASMLNHWLNDAKSELELLSSLTETLEGIEIEDSDNLVTLFFDLDIDVVVCFTLTSLEYEDRYISTLENFLHFDRFRVQVGFNTYFSVESSGKWFSDHNVIVKMIKDLTQFRRFAEANKDNKKIHFIISSIANPSIEGSSIYLYEKGELTDTQFKPMSKPPPPIVKNVKDQTVYLKLPKSSSRGRVQYRVEYKPIKPHNKAEEPWHSMDTYDEDFTLTGLESGQQYWIRYRRVDKVGVSEASDTVSTSSFVTWLPNNADKHTDGGQPLIVGGRGGDEFSIKSTYNDHNTIKKIVIYYSMETIQTIQLFLEDDQMIQVGKNKGRYKEELEFDKTDKIVSAKLWPNRPNDRFCGLEFKVKKTSGEITKMSVKCNNLGVPVFVNVRSGNCQGMKGRAGHEIDALGFYFN